MIDLTATDTLQNRIRADMGSLPIPYRVALADCLATVTGNLVEPLEINKAADNRVELI